MNNFYFKTRKRMIAWICAITMVVAGLTVVPKTVAADDTETDYSSITTWKNPGFFGQTDSSVYVVGGVSGKKYNVQIAKLDAESKGNIGNNILIQVYNQNFMQITWGEGDYKGSYAFLNGEKLKSGKAGVQNTTAGMVQLQTDILLKADSYNKIKVICNETEYATFAIKVGNPGGSGTETPGETKPNAPTNLRATINDLKTNFTISFDVSNTKAESYNLYIDDDLRIEKINNNFILDIEDFGLESGRTYVIGVSSVNSQGESVDKATVEIKIPVKITIDNKVKDTVTPGSDYTLPTSVNGFYDKDNKVIYKGGSKVTVNSDMNLVEIKGLSVELTNGAAIRLDDKTGIRYQAKVNVDIDAKNDATVKEEILKSGVVSAGILVTTDDILGKNELTAQSNAKKVDIKNKKGEWFSNPGVFCGSIINIKEANYPRSFVARAYASINYSDKTQSNQVYSEIKVKRSIAQVAHLIQQGGYQGIGAEDKTVIDMFAGYFK